MTELSAAGTRRTEVVQVTEWRVAQRRLLSQVVARQIRDAIGAGSLRPGERLVETDIAAGLGVSKTPVREALRELEAEGLVVIVPGRGSFVREMSAADIRDIAMLRATLEGLALRLAIQRGPDPDWNSSLREALEAMRAATDPSQLNDAHAHLHRLLSDRSGSARLSSMLEALRVQVKTFLSFVDLLYDPAAMADDHAELVDAVERGDLGGIQQLVDQHILGDAERLAGLWSKAGTGDSR